MRSALAVAVLLAVLPACPGQKVEPPKKTCTKAGESCEFAPGKLGICVEPVSGGAPICQSQH